MNLKCFECGRQVGMVQGVITSTHVPLCTSCWDALLDKAFRKQARIVWLPLLWFTFGALGSWVYLRHLFIPLR